MANESKRKEVRKLENEIFSTVVERYSNINRSSVHFHYGLFP